MADHEQLSVESREQWREWLAANHAAVRGAWAVTWKKHSGGRYVSYDDLVEEALAFGWVDSQGRGLDERRTQLFFTPRKPRSGWSRPNKERIARLTAEGRMAPAGLAAVEVAKANGAWSALDDIENLVEPADLAAALDRDPAARREWDGFPRSVKRAILVWIGDAKRPQTREKRVQETARLAAQGIRANQ